MFSTYVEMILTVVQALAKSLSVLHVCGDDPQLLMTIKAVKTVFSTYVEMIPDNTVLTAIYESVLHVCGDDPKQLFLVLLKSKCSPRMWR